MDESIQDAVGAGSETAQEPQAQESAQSKQEANPAPATDAEKAQQADSKQEQGLASDEAGDQGDAPKGMPAGGYSFDGLEVEEGLEIDQPTAEAFAKIAEEVGLSQDAFNTVYNKLMPYLNQRQEEQLQELRTKFFEDARNDSEIGGSKYKENLSLARQAFKKFVDPETAELLQASGLDCHPGLIRAFVNVGRAISNDAVVRGEAVKQRDPAKAFFNNSNMN